MLSGKHGAGIASYVNGVDGRDTLICEVQWEDRVTGNGMRVIVRVSVSPADIVKITRKESWTRPALAIVFILEQEDRDLYDRVQEQNLLRQYDLLTNCIEIGLLWLSTSICSGLSTT